MIKVLKTLNSEMKTLNINYCYDDWNKEVQLPYYVGELSEIPTFNEDGKSEYTFKLTGFDAKSYLNLFKTSDDIRDYYKYGKKIILEDNSAIVIAYENTLPVDTEVEDLKRIEINLNVKLWEK